MSPVAQRLTLIYVLALLLLAGVGSAAQNSYRAQARLLLSKEQAIVSLANARAAAARVNGPLAVGQWARAAGMVPAPDAESVEGVAAGLTAPKPPVHPIPWVEVVTVWR
jgi:hypothetical protein